MPHAHPLAAESRTASPMVAGSGRSTPAVPPGLENTIKVPPSEISESIGVIARPSRAAAEISLGSPRPKANVHQRTVSEKSLTTVEYSEKEKEKATDEPPTATATPVKATKPREPRQKPIKLDISLADLSRDISPSKASTPSYSAAAIAAPGSTASRPNTPGTVISKASEISLRHPRVLRVVDTPKLETAPPAPAAPSRTSTPVTKQKSRKPSLSSISRPETPGEFGSEYTSASVSRANSPPPSRIGSAPVRAVTKNQMKKDRKLKAKQAEDKEKEIAAAAVPEEPVIAPIMGRKRKTKKPKPSGESSPTPMSETEKPKKEEVVVKEEKTYVAPQKKEPEEPWRTNNTLEQLFEDAEAAGATIKDLFLERTVPLPALLAELHVSQVLDLNTHPLFNPPPAQQRVDMKCSADDYYDIKKPIELTAEHKKQLLCGEAVRINPDSSLLKDRCLITPSGCVLRHLSAEEEERVLALEDNPSESIDSLFEYPPLSISEPDLTNRDGGLDALFATPEKFNIRWVDEPPQSSLLTGPSEAVGDNSWAMTMDSTPARSAASKLYSAGPGFGGELEELLSMPDDELRMMIQTAQRELEVSRKEADVVDKKVIGLVKRNKKIVQLALATVMAFMNEEAGRK